MKKQILTFLTSCCLLIVLGCVVGQASLTVYAAVPTPGGDSLPGSKTAPAGECGNNYIELGVPLNQDRDGDGENDNCLRKQLKEENTAQNPIYKYLRGIIRFLSAGVGVVVILMIVISGVQYITSSGNPDAIQAARKRLTNAVLALVLFIFMYAILEFLIPGRLF